jgi:hypothetical protein
VSWADVLLAWFALKQIAPASFENREAENDGAAT